MFLPRHFIVAAAASTIAGRAMNEVGASEDQLAAALFPDRGEPAVFAHVAEAAKPGSPA